MRKRLIIIVVLISSFRLFSQEFSFEMIFEDAIGNTDTLIMGYDPLATDTTDNLFGEVNIINNPFDSIFDIRISDEWSAREMRTDSSGTYHLKKQIVNGTCDTYKNTLSIDIKCKNWPVSARWDKTLFLSDCLKEGFFTSIPPGGWWDVSTPSNLIKADLYNINEVTFTNNYEIYISNNQDTVSVFWLQFGFDVVSVNFLEKPKSEIKLLSNPLSENITIIVPDSESVKEVRIFDLSGKQRVFDSDINTIDIRTLNKGIYILKVITGDNIITTLKLIKY